MDFESLVYKSKGRFSGLGVESHLEVPSSNLKHCMFIFRTPSIKIVDPPRFTIPNWHTMTLTFTFSKNKVPSIHPRALNLLNHGIDVH